MLYLFNKTLRDMQKNSPVAKHICLRQHMLSMATYRCNCFRQFFFFFLSLFLSFSLPGAERRDALVVAGAGWQRLVGDLPALHAERNLAGAHVRCKRERVLGRNSWWRWWRRNDGDCTAEMQCLHSRVMKMIHLQNYDTKGLQLFKIWTQYLGFGLVILKWTPIR